MTAVPAKRPCPTCPYRRDVPPGVWNEVEYAKLPRYDGPTGEQPFSAFFCHTQPERLCAGWVGTHDMEESMGLRLAGAFGYLTADEVEAVRDYTTDVPLFASGAEAAAHGRSGIDAPRSDTLAAIDRLLRKRGRRRASPLDAAPSERDDKRGSQSAASEGDRDE